VAGTWSLYWNGLVDGASPRPAAWAGAAVQQVASRLGRRWPAVHQLAAAPGALAGAEPGGVPAAPEFTPRGEAPPEFTRTGVRCRNSPPCGARVPEFTPRG
jgi:hypothetical protein